MDTLVLLLGFLQAVLGVVSNSTISQSKKDTALSYLSLLGVLVEAGIEVNDALKTLTERLQSGTPISDDEWAKLKQRSDTAHAAIQQSDPSPPPSPGSGVASNPPTDDRLGDPEEHPPTE